MNNRTRDVVCMRRADSALSYLLWSGLVWRIPLQLNLYRGVLWGYVCVNICNWVEEMQSGLHLNFLQSRPPTSHCSPSMLPCGWYSLTPCAPISNLRMSELLGQIIMLSSLVSMCNIPKIQFPLTTSAAWNVLCGTYFSPGCTFLLYR